ncbi:hypothetical protein Adi01nite_36250 [Amorphoplanes digitatis]|nr:hypothetical protein Adi01nite_36250 [Actinoplanes digitatis]
MTLSLHRGRGGEVDAVEIYRPEQDVTVLFRDIPLFDLPEGRPATGFRSEAAALAEPSAADGVREAVGDRCRVVACAGQ